MVRSAAGLDSLTRHERSSLRALLLRATAAAGGRRVDGELEQLVHAAPVESLPAAAGLHRLGGTVLRGLDGVDGVPGDVTARLGELKRQSSLRHLLITGALSEIARTFDDAGLAWVAIKGPVVAALLYPEPGDRTYGDLDLLVDRRDFPRAMQLLENLGYEHSIHDWLLAEKMMAGQVTMSRAAVAVDLHWHLHYSQEDRGPFDIDPEAMVARRRIVTASGVKIPTLDPVDTLLMLAFHAARSDGHRLVWMKDIEREVAVEQPDLDEVIRRSRAARCAPPVGIMLGRSRALLDADVPDETIRALTPRTLREADRVVAAISQPVRLSERPTLNRTFTRSVRSSAVRTLLATPSRGLRRARRWLFPPPPNETDDLDEKSSYLAAVSSGG
jgi:hypothetical protein